MCTLRRIEVAAVCVVVGLLLYRSPVVRAEQSQGDQKSAGQLLLEIMDLHGQLITNDVFLAQAKMLGAYLESAQPMEEARKMDIYRRVLDMLLKIKETHAQAPASSVRENAKAVQKVVEQEQGDSTVFVPGAALLEVFKADSIETLPALPVIRTYWPRGLGYAGGFLLPDRFSDIGRGSRYVARFSFYYEAKEPGDYGFTVLHNEKANACKVTVGGVDVVRVSKEPAGQGVCTLNKGFHRVECWLLSSVGQRGALSSDYRPEMDRPGKREEMRNSMFTASAYSMADFGVKVLVPNGSDAVPLTKDMMLLKADDVKKSPEQQGKK